MNAGNNKINAGETRNILSRARRDIKSQGSASVRGRKTVRKDNIQRQSRAAEDAGTLMKHQMYEELVRVKCYCVC